MQAALDDCIAIGPRLHPLASCTGSKGQRLRISKILRTSISSIRAAGADRLHKQRAVALAKNTLLCRQQAMKEFA
jgi:hypothetical protein